MYTVGRLSQLAALALLPLAMFLELTGALGEHGLSEMLKIMIFGFVLFYTGRILQGYSKV
jgi:hypothetical protein